MNIYIISHETKLGKSICSTAYFDIENARYQMKKLVRARIELLPDNIKWKKEKLSENLISLLENDSVMESYRISTLKTENLGCTIESVLNKKSFIITCVSKEDLESRGFDTSNVTDSQMERLADKMGDDYVNQMFWDSLDTIAETMEIPRKKKTLEELLPKDGSEIDISDQNDAPSWTFFDSDNNGYTDRATAVRLRNGKVEIRWEGERCNPANWEPLEYIEDEPSGTKDDLILMLIDSVKNVNSHE